MSSDDFNFECLTPKEVAALLHTTLSFVYEHRAALGGFKLAGAVRFRLCVLQQRILELEGKNKKVQKLYFCYTTCPKCAKAYGKNYVVLFAKID
jgi:hypothetical protein